MTKPVKALVVDDSALMRRIITDLLEQDEGIEVIGFARNGPEALEKIPRLKPEVVTLDVEMPDLNGLQTLRLIMQQCPLPVIMLSAVTTEGAQATLKALDFGAVDFVAKPGRLAEMKELAIELPQKVKMAAGVRVDKFRPESMTVPVKSIRSLSPGRLSAGTKEFLAIGTSTGGPSALQTVFSVLPGDFPVPIMVVQHMPKGFTKSLAERLNSHSEVSVKEGEPGDVLRAGQALVVPAGWQPRLIKKGTKVTLELVREAPVETLFKPSVDVLVLEAARVYGPKCLAVLLTGMGNDGVRGLKSLKEQGGQTIVEAESSCVVYGMPRAAVEAGVADSQVPLAEMGTAIIEAITR